MTNSGTPRHAGLRASAAGCRTVIATVIVAVAAARGPAATINVPADQATIQGAINAAAGGDTIIVAPGTYGEFVNIDRGVTLVSSGGAAVTIIQRNVNNDTPIVDITVPGVTLGGPAAGFTINQQDPGPAAAAHAGNCAVRIRGEMASSATEPTTITIEGCVLTGNQADEGLLVNQNLTNAHLIVKSCTFSRNGGAYSFRDALHFHYSNPGGQLNTNVSANDCIIDLLGLTLTEYDRGGVYFHDSLHKTVLNVEGGTFSGRPNGDALYFGDNIVNFSALNVTGLNVENGWNVLYVSGDITNQSSIEVSNLSADGFRSDGIYVSGSVERAGTLMVQNTTLAGNGTTAGYGIYAYVEDGASALIDGCTISGVSDGGVYLEDIYNGSMATITNNQITLYGGGSGYGIYTDTEYGSHTLVRGNTVSGFDYAGIYEDYPYAGSSVAIEENTLNADAGGADYSVYVGDLDYGCEASVVNNTATNFDYAGVYIGYTEYGSMCTVAGNTLTARAANGSTYGIYAEYTYYQSDLIVNDNAVTGYNDTGLYLYDVYYDSTVTANDNVLTAHPTGAYYGIYAYEIYDGGTASFSGNQVSGFGNKGGGEYGFYNDEVSEGGNLTLTGNTFNAHAAFGDYGFYSSDGFEDGAMVQIVGNTFTGFLDAGLYFDDAGYDGCVTHLIGNTVTAAAAGAEYGIHISSTIDYGCTTLIENNTIGGVTEYGLYIDGVDDGSMATVRNNTFNMAPGGTSTMYGIYYSGETDYGSTNEVLGNIFNGIIDPDGGGGNEGYGIYMEGATGGSSETVADNVVNASGPGDTYGIYCNYVADTGSTFDLLRNRVTGATHSAIYLNDDTGDGGRFMCADNHTEGGEFGIHYDSSYDIEAGSNAWFERNVISGFTDTGMYFGGYVWGSIVDISLNRISGDAANYGIFFNKEFDSGAEVDIHNNCISGVTTGISVQDILDTSFAMVHFNDLSATTTGIVNVAGDAAHTIDATNNYFGAATPATGNVDVGSALGAPTDEDGDGVIDCSDECPETPADQSADENGCSCQQLFPDLDTDGDTAIDCVDGCPTDPNKVEPGACGCGVAETDTDGDGTPDCVDGCPSDPAKTDPGVCGCGTSDVDSDGDGTPNCNDGCSADAAKTAPGVCGCGTPDIDGDGDGTPDCVDGCPSDAEKTDPGVCGCGVAETDSDGDTVADCIDLCPDAPGTVEALGCPDGGDDSGQGVPDIGCGAGTTGCGTGGAGLMPLGLLGLLGMRRTTPRRRR